MLGPGEGEGVCGWGLEDMVQGVTGGDTPYSPLYNRARVKVSFRGLLSRAQHNSDVSWQ